MPDRSGDYDAREMVRGSMIGKKLFGEIGLPTGPGLAPGAGGRSGLLIRWRIPLARGVFKCRVRKAMSSVCY
jgi:hypothetical protein